LLKVILTLVQSQWLEIGHNLLHIICQDLSADSESEKILSIRKLMAEYCYRHFNMSKIPRFSIITPVEKEAREMILTFLDFFRRGLPTHKKSAS
jgi:hypothetical protein